MLKEKRITFIVLFQPISEKLNNLSYWKVRNYTNIPKKFSESVEKWNETKKWMSHNQMNPIKRRKIMYQLRIKRNKGGISSWIEMGTQRCKEQEIVKFMLHQSKIVKDIQEVHKKNFTRIIPYPKKYIRERENRGKYLKIPSSHDLS